MKIRAKKSLGQNFLIDKQIIEKIVECAEIKNKYILEVGPGTGNLTKAIIKKKPKKIFLVEKDKVLINKLKDELNYDINFINRDILDINENELSENLITVFGNLPYNISTKILTKWIKSIHKKLWFDKLILMFQKEVADRILSTPNNKNYGRLSILANWKLKITKITDVHPHSFNPSPKIESTLLLFELKNDIFKLRNPETLEKITRIFFNQRRKKIKKAYYQLFKDCEIAKSLNLDLNLRPQNLDEITFYMLALEYEKLNS